MGDCARTDSFSALAGFKEEVGRKVLTRPPGKHATYAGEVISSDASGITVQFKGLDETIKLPRGHDVKFADSDSPALRRILQRTARCSLWDRAVFAVNGAVLLHSVMQTAGLDTAVPLQSLVMLATGCGDVCSVLTNPYSRPHFLLLAAACNLVNAALPAVALASIIVFGRESLPLRFPSPSGYGHSQTGLVLLLLQLNVLQVSSLRLSLRALRELVARNANPLRALFYLHSFLAAWSLSAAQAWWEDQVSQGDTSHAMLALCMRVLLVTLSLANSCSLLLRIDELCLFGNIAHYGAALLCLIHILPKSVQGVLGWAEGTLGGCLLLFLSSVLALRYAHDLSPDFEKPRSKKD